MKTLIGTTLLALVAGVGICAAADAAAGKTAYDAKCKSCHGADGVPSAAMAKMMSLKPLGSAEVQALSNADMKKIVVEGKGKMKPTAGLAATGADDLVAHIRTFKK